MKIIIFDGTFKTTTFINRLIKGLSLNHEVFVLGFNESVKSKITGVHYVGLGSNTSILIFILRSVKLRGFNFMKQFKLVLQLLKGLKSEITQDNFQLAIDAIQPDIIHFQWVSVLSYLENLKLPKCTKTILSQRGFHINVRPFINQDNKVFLNEVFSKLDGFHSVSKAIQKKSNEIYTSPQKIDHVVYSGFDIDSFGFKNTWNTNKKIQILSIGRDHWKKDYRSAILAMSILKKKKIPFHYTVVGVNKSEELLFLVNELNLTDSVTFLNSIPQEEVYEKMLESDLFLLPSVEEGIANVCIEAMLSKLPVLSTDCGGMSELIVDSVTGFLIPTRSPKAIADKISIFAKLQEIDILQLVNAAYMKSTTQHNSEQMVNGMISLYEKL
ncbi:MAG: glycosyltransferase family 4 protein [Flavobacteriaceae bacterium]|nr:glycosyltransferase family 4 protein [Flavobacteriaceae bacterium]